MKFFPAPTLTSYAVGAVGALNITGVPKHVVAIQVTVDDEGYFSPIYAAAFDEMALILELAAAEPPQLMEGEGSTYLLAAHPYAT